MVTKITRVQQQGSTYSPRLTDMPELCGLIDRHGMGRFQRDGSWMECEGASRAIDPEAGSRAARGKSKTTIGSGRSYWPQMRCMSKVCRSALAWSVSRQAVRTPRNRRAPDTRCAPGAGTNGGMMGVMRMALHARLRGMAMGSPLRAAADGLLSS